MTNEEKKYIRKIQAVLTSIKIGKPIFFNIAQYKKYGLVYTTNKKAVNAHGNIVTCGTNIFLTDKAKQYLNVII